MQLLLHHYYDHVLLQLLLYHSKQLLVQKNELWQFQDQVQIHLQNHHHLQILRLRHHHQVLHLLPQVKHFQLLQVLFLLQELQEFLHQILDLNSQIEYRQDDAHPLKSHYILVKRLQQH